MDSGYLAHACQKPQRVGVPKTAGFDIQAQMPGAVFTLYPAEAVAVVVEPVWAHRFQDIAQALFQLRLEPVQAAMVDRVFQARSEENTSELQSLMRISYAVFCLKKNTQNTNTQQQI